MRAGSCTLSDDVLDRKVCLKCVCVRFDVVAGFTTSIPYTDMNDGNWELSCAPGPASDGIFMYALPSGSLLFGLTDKSFTRSLLAPRFSEFEPVAISDWVVLVVSEVKGLLRER